MGESNKVKRVTKEKSVTVVRAGDIMFLTLIIFSSFLVYSALLGLLKFSLIFTLEASSHSKLRIQFSRNGEGPNGTTLSLDRGLSNEPEDDAKENIVGVLKEER